VMTSRPLPTNTYRPRFGPGIPRAVVVFANINRPIAGPTHDKELPRGENPLQLYSLATPNGVKVTALLEELIDLGHAGAEYDAYTINIGEGQQFGSDFVDINPNSKIPALLDLSTPTPTRVFESGAIMVYLGRKIWCLAANRTIRPRRVYVVAVLADGQCPLSRAAALVTFMPMPRSRCSTRLIASRWKSSVS
jgi:hypothetical protein